MVEIHRRLSIGILALSCWASGMVRAEKFYPDDPLQSMPKPVPVGEVRHRKFDPLYDLMRNSIRPHARPPLAAGAVNTLGEVPDSEWYTNRHGRKRMTREELQRGPGNENPPVPPFVVVGAKTEGVTPGFRMKDARGRLYFVKPDPFGNPEMATAADVIGSKFFYALGYNTPENYLVYVRPFQLSVGKEAVVEVAGRRRPMTEKDIKIILNNGPRRQDGSYRLLASLDIPGELAGPFEYEGTRSDDPNDVVPHERRRDLRGLKVFCAWLNHTDTKSGNTMNSVAEVDGVRVVRHYLLDFNAILGSDSDRPKDARFGNAFFLPEPRTALFTMITLGFYSPAWERAKYPNDTAIGRLESRLFDPEKWRSNYPNPAFLSCQPDDEYWAAKQVMAFTDDDIRAIVETGQYSDSRVLDYMTAALADRRDKIGRTYFSKVLALDHFAIADGALVFEDLAVRYQFIPARAYHVAWSRFDNQSEKHTPLSGESSLRLPGDLQRAEDGAYFAARIYVKGEDAKTVTVYLRKRNGAVEVVGIERTW